MNSADFAATKPLDISRTGWQNFEFFPVMCGDSPCFDLNRFVFPQARENRQRVG